MGPLKVFSFIDCNATSAVFHHILGLFPFIAHIKLSSGLWSSNTRSDNWTMYDSSELSSLSLTVDALYIYNLRWDTISTLLRHNSTIAKNITSLRLSMVFEYYSPRVVGELLVQMSSLRHVHIGPYPTHLGSSQLWMEYSHGQAFQDLRLSQCHQLESAEYSFLLTTNAAEMAVHLALLVQADLPASARELRFSFFESIPWCAAPPKSEADREAWTLLDRRMLHTPSRIRFCISNARDPRTQALDWQEVSVVQAFFDAALPGVTATGRLSVLGGAPVSPSASRSCACSACASPGGQ
ncbi:hypothetical protein L226DRAFT_539185 [Lentinus tigrinus ALCF2SS1-7]|uniref:uncharacterized protein n=1 Tax=Lentinus tigrinus ALCF2SS1-7 TaxID=1328758 RepID=UPI001165CF8D|nr:hypothetical protein L226DRAFT_539185 [Lentinus tigrinus ALCF2SS1-7]